MKPLTRDWVQKAEGDFLVANQIMRRRKNRVFDIALRVQGKTSFDVRRSMFDVPSVDP
jgi:hypothetical protein